MISAGVSNARKLFEKMDADGSGQVSTEELLRELTRPKTGLQRSDSMIDLARSIDTSGDGEISYGEFENWVGC